MEVSLHTILIDETLSKKEMAEEAVLLIEENCPKLNGVFECRFNTYYWIKLVVENGKSYLECGSHGSDFTYALSKTETATFSRGSMQSKPYAYKDTFFFRNERLEEFLSQWETIKVV